MKRNGLLLAFIILFIGARSQTVLVDSTLYATFKTHPQLAYLQGEEDARHYYHNGNAAARGTFFTTLLAGGLLGLIPAILTSSATPKDKNLGYPNADLMKNQDYYRGYTHKAKSRKSGKVWLSWGIGMVIAISAFIVVASTQQ